MALEATQVWKDNGISQDCNDEQTIKSVMYTFRY
ncbi:hypothetical protein A1122_12425 [Yersinia pestis A1122]|nr:hypothetical protein A1122_12425 [Yersinia pestis A1122]KGA55321.1 hypothetical protein DJ56_3053 [Yersinia pestis]KNC62432.1 hypothetical protein M485_1107 [Yersinia pestis 14735]